VFLAQASCSLDVGSKCIARAWNLPLFRGAATSTLGCGQEHGSSETPVWLVIREAD
jgi:hypothetical protein